MFKSNFNNILKLVDILLLMVHKNIFFFIYETESFQTHLDGWIAGLRAQCFEEELLDIVLI